MLFKKYDWDVLKTKESTLLELSLKMDKKFKTLLNALLLYKKVGFIKFRPYEKWNNVEAKRNTSADHFVKQHP